MRKFLYAKLLDVILLVCDRMLKMILQYVEMFSTMLAGLWLLRRVRVDFRKCRAFVTKGKKKLLKCCVTMKFNYLCKNMHALL